MPKKRINLSDAEYGRRARIMDWHAGLKWRDNQHDTFEGRDFLITELKRLPTVYKNTREYLINYLEKHYNKVIGN